MPNQQSPKRKRSKKKFTFSKLANNPLFQAILKEIAPSAKTAVVSAIAKNSPQTAALLDTGITTVSNARKRVRKDKRKERDRAPPVVETVRRKMLDCATDFVHAVNDPYSISSNICLPLAPLIPSFKTVIKKDFNMTAGTNGFAFCAVTPNLSSELSLYASQAAYTGTTVVDDVTAGVNIISNGALFASSSFTTTLGEDAFPLTGRIVLVAMQIVPLATLMNRKGIIKLFSHPTRGSVAGLTSGDVSNWATTQRYDIASSGNGLKPQLVQIASRPEEWSYEQTSDSALSIKAPWSTQFLAQAGTAASPCLGCIVDGCTTGDAFNVSLRIFVEYAGPVVNSYASVGSLSQESYDLGSSILNEKNYSLAQGINIF